MNAVFPELLFLGPYFAPVLIRLGVALYFLLHARAMWELKTDEGKLLAGKELAFALLIAGGVLTQLIALFGILVVWLRGVWLGKDAPKETLREKLLATAALSALVITGAGYSPFPFSDLPY